MSSDPAITPVIAAIDLGKSRVGLAITDALGMYAHPRPALKGQNRKVLLEALRLFARDNDVTRFLVGYPLNLAGEATTAAERAARFCQQLATVTQLPVELVDERLTSVEAERYLEEMGLVGRAKQEKVDGVAAAIVLQQWLERHRPS